MNTSKDGAGTTPEAFVREFLAAYRDWELWAISNDESDADQAADAEGAIDAQYRRVLERYATPNVLAQDLRATWQSPPQADLSKTEFVGVDVTGDAATVRTIEVGHAALPRFECEYKLKLIDGSCRLDDRREQDGRGGWIQGVF